MTVRLRLSPADPNPLVPLGPVAQLRAGRMARRLPQLFLGLTLYGFSMAMMIRATLGLDPWDVFHYGAALHVPLSIGSIIIVASFVVLLLWLPLRQMPGLGTIVNAIWIGVATDLGLALLSVPEAVVTQAALMVGGIVLNALAGALYIGSQLGPGPRDGLMTGLHARTGWSLRVVRTSIEVTVLAIGWLLGGPVGLGTVLYAVSIGPLVQFFLPRCTVRLDSARVAELTPRTGLATPSPAAHLTDR